MKKILTTLLVTTLFSLSCYAAENNSPFYTKSIPASDSMGAVNISYALPVKSIGILCKVTGLTSLKKNKGGKVNSTDNFKLTYLNYMQKHVSYGFAPPEYNYLYTNPKFQYTHLCENLTKDRDDTQCSYDLASNPTSGNITISWDTLTVNSTITCFHLSNS